jgi:hypothetical protein
MVELKVKKIQIKMEIKVRDKVRKSIKDKVKSQATTVIKSATSPGPRPVDSPWR